MSIASAPERLPQLELHFRALPGVAEAQLMDEILHGAADGSRDIAIDGPLRQRLRRRPRRARPAADRGRVGHRAMSRDRGASAVRAADARRASAVERHRGESAVLRRRTARICAVAALHGADRCAEFGECRRRAGYAGSIAHRRASGRRVIISGGPGFVYAVADALTEIGARGDVGRIGRIQLRATTIAFGAPAERSGDSSTSPPSVNACANNSLARARLAGRQIQAAQLAR